MDRDEANIVGMVVSTLPEPHRTRLCNELTECGLGYEFTCGDGVVTVAMTKTAQKKRAELSAKLMAVGANRKKGAPDGRM